MPLSPYTSFAGNCADAIAYYQEASSAELLYKIDSDEMPRSAQDNEDSCPSGLKFPATVIAHVNLRITGSDIMMSDGVPDGNVHYPGSTSVLDMQNADEGKRWSDNLAANGKIEMDWQKISWTYGFGKVNDQYGMPQMINVIKQQQPSTE